MKTYRKVFLLSIAISFLFLVVTVSLTNFHTYDIVEQRYETTKALASGQSLSYMTRYNANDRTPITKSCPTYANWDTEIDHVGTDITYSAGNFTLKKGRYFVMYSDYFYNTSTTNNERIQGISYILLNDSAQDSGSNYFYIRRSDGNLECQPAGTAIIDIPNDNMKLGVYYIRLDNTADAISPLRVEGYGGIAILKLDDDWDWGIYNATAQDSSTAVTKWQEIVLDNTVEEDPNFSRTGNNVTITDRGKYLVAYTVPTYEASGRTENSLRLAINGTEIPGTEVHMYNRDYENDYDGSASWAGIIHAGPGSTLKLETYESDGVIKIDVGAGFQIVQLPSNAKTFRAYSNNGETNPAAITEFQWDTEDFKSSDTYSFSAGNTYFDVEEPGTYMFFSSMHSTNGGARVNPTSFISVNDTVVDGCVAGSYGRSSGADDPGHCIAWLMNCSSADQISIENLALGNAGATDADQASVSAIRLDDIMVESEDEADWIQNTRGWFTFRNDLNFTQEKRGFALFFNNMNFSQNAKGFFNFSNTPTGDVYGIINGIEDTWEFDEQESYIYNPYSLLKMGDGPYYMTSAYGDTGADIDGFLRILNVTDDGDIQEALADSWEYDVSDGRWAGLCHITGDLYAVIYNDESSNIGKVCTFRAFSNNGTFTKSILDTYEFNSDIGVQYPSLTHVTGELYVVFYQETSLAGYDHNIETINISSDGSISDNHIDFEDDDWNWNSYSVGLNCVPIDEDTFAFVVTEVQAGGYGWVFTHNISDTGIITDAYADAWKFNGDGGAYFPYIQHIAGNTFAIAYKGNDSDGDLGTLQISDDGTINKIWNDTFEFDNTLADYISMFEIANANDYSPGVYGITYINDGDDAYLKTINISIDGTIENDIVDSIEIDNDEEWFYLCQGYTPMVHIDNGFYLVTFTDENNDGWVKVINITSPEEGEWIQNTTGWFTFNNNQNFTQNTNGFFTFLNNLNYTQENRGWFTFFNNLNFSQNDKGYFLFQNNQNFTQDSKGFFTFSHNQNFTQSKKGFFTFNNNLNFTQSKKGFFTFSHNQNYTQSKRGWFRFNNDMNHTQNSRGFFTFLNNMNFSYSKRGWFIFAHNQNFSQEKKGFFRFQNNLNFTQSDKGWFRFLNNQNFSTEKRGHFLFSSNLNFTRNTRGFFRFNNNLNFTRDTLGWFRFNNKLNFSQNNKGYFTFSHNQNFTQSKKGFFKFLNNMNHSQTDNGFFRFKNDQNYTRNTLGWFNFTGEAGEYVQNKKGYFNFFNNMNYTNSAVGWTTFGNDLNFSQSKKGFFKFNHNQNYSQSNKGFFKFCHWFNDSMIVGDRGWFTFENNETAMDLFGLSPVWNITWSGNASLATAINPHDVWINSSGTYWETVQINLSINSTTWVEDIAFWVHNLYDPVNSSCIGADNISVWVSTDNITFSLLEDTNGAKMGHFPHGGGYLYWNDSTSPMGADPFSYFGGGQYITDATTKIWARFRLNVTMDCDKGWYENHSGFYDVEILNNSKAELIDYEYFTARAYVDKLERDWSQDSKGWFTFSNNLNFTRNTNGWFNFSNTLTPSDWWNNDWTYRKSLTICNKIDDYQMKLFVGNSTGGNVTCEGHANSDFGDIRFIYNNVTELPYWRENYTTDTQATFWINNSGNYSLIYMYYGNNATSTTSDGDSTFIFFDDAESGGIEDKWLINNETNAYSNYNETQAYSGNWSIILNDTSGQFDGANNTYCMRYFPSQSAIKWGFRYYRVNTGSDSDVDVIYGDDSYCAVRRVYETKDIRYYNDAGGEQDTGYNFNLSEWEKWEYRAYDNGTNMEYVHLICDTTVGNSTNVGDVCRQSKNPSFINRTYFATYPNDESTAYFDDVYIAKWVIPPTIEPNFCGFGAEEVIEVENWSQEVRGFFIFNNDLNFTQSVRGWFTFNSNLNWSYNSTGFFTFSHNQNYTFDKAGFFLFSNNMNYTYDKAGWFVFAHNQNFTIEDIGWFNFTTPNAWLENASGWFNFSNEDFNLTVWFTYEISGGVLICHGHYIGNITQFAWNVTKAYSTYPGSTNWINYTGQNLVHTFSATEQNVFEVTFSGRNVVTDDNETRFIELSPPPPQSTPTEDEITDDSLPVAPGDYEIMIGEVRIDVRVIAVMVVLIASLIIIGRKERRKYKKTKKHKISWEEKKK